jgi:hypothetical protein
MKKFFISVVALTLICSIVEISEVYGLDFGKDKEITLFDGVAKSGGSRWSSYESWWNTEREDQEVEYMNQRGQAWDLEGMFLDGTSLTLVGGYDFKNGYHSRYTGDLFFDVDGDITYGTNIIGDRSRRKNRNIDNIFGYDYVIDMTFDPSTLSETYQVYKIDESATLKTGYWSENDTSGAWRYVGGGDLVSQGEVSYQTGLTNAQTGFKGGNHNALTVDIGFLDSGTEFTAHYTMGCGNDDLIGRGSAPVVATPEPGTLALLGFGLLGLVALVRKRIR